MIFKNPALRLSLVLVLLLLNLLFLANLLGIIPDRAKLALEMRKGLSESLALQFSFSATKGDFQTVQETLRAVVERNREIRSAAIRTVDGNLIALAGEHLANWTLPEDGKSSTNQVRVPLYKKGKEWGSVEIRFVPLWQDNVIGGFNDSFVWLLIFAGLGGFACFFMVMKRALRELDPTAVIPERVQNAFDILKEGVLILDEKEQIVMANRSFARLVGRSTKELVGFQASELEWLDFMQGTPAKRLPWKQVLDDGKNRSDVMLALRSEDGGKTKLAVNAAIVTDNDGEFCGSLVTFDDVTQLEEKNFELNQLVEKLQLAQDEMSIKSQELEFLANQDPLTHCLNRRSLDRLFKTLFERAGKTGKDLSCLMVDIDFFKSVNDRYGHTVGDQVIKAVAEVLKSCTRDTDLVGRYGGEEYCLIMPDMTIDRAMQLGERIRHTVEKNRCGGVKVTVSVGVSSLAHKAGRPDELVNQADKALYAAKQSGRNIVVQWGADANELHGPHFAQRVQEKDPAVLNRKIEMLEGLLEKRSMEVDHFQIYDFNTGLPTRTLFNDRVSHEIARSKRRDELVVVLSMSIETIKRVHDSVGRDAAEQLIRACGRRLNDILREDVDTVAVVEMDRKSSVSLINQTEFGILLTDFKQVDHVVWVIKRLRDAFEMPFVVDQRELYVTAYFGAAIYPQDGTTADDLFSSAMNACSYAKSLKGKDRYQFATVELNTLAARHLQIENALHKALDNDEFSLKYQPQVDTKTGRVVGVEALLRWDSRTLGTISPAEFIQIAEQSGQINAIGEWVLRGACLQMRSWLDAGVALDFVAVNLSGVQLRQRDLPGRIQKIMAEAKLDSGMLEIELTESSLVNFHDQSFSVLAKIKELGIRVTMDDFGTGYSSLSYLKEMPLSCVKIDRSFVMDIGKNENSDKLIASIVSMAQSLGLTVVAEGIEDQNQCDYLTSIGCEFLQGYYISRPIARETVPGFIMERQVSPASAQ
ncbi:MAG: EAL domain-containing protein [Desulfuromonadales bacterium]|nr:EAL domain-containing protein [Desulfuromonadales bacterium]